MQKYYNTKVDSRPREARIPRMADLFVAYSTYRGFVALRDTSDGCIFVQEVCKMINKNFETDDINTILTKAMDKIAIEFEANLGDEKAKVAPELTSTLRLRFGLNLVSAVPSYN